LNPALIPIDES